MDGWMEDESCGWVWSKSYSTGGFLFLWDFDKVTMLLIGSLFKRFISLPKLHKSVFCRCCKDDEASIGVSVQSLK